jgi:isopenicillin N synthase-like dioxygenase
MTAFPLVDIAPWRDGSDRASVARAVDEALCASGFLLITGHGVPDDDRAAARSAARTVFALPPEHKAPYAVAVGGHGYLGPGAEANAAAEGVAGPPDLKESWTLGADDPTGDPALDAIWFAPNVWPAEVPALQTTLEQHMHRMRALADTLLEIGAAGLGLEADHFTRHTRHPSYTLNVNRYPPLTEVGPPAPDQFRIGAHTDFGTFTVLDREPGVGGLQIWASEATGDDDSDLPGHGWIDAPHVPGALTVNVGDLLARWTGERWRSTRHRVLPPQACAPDEDLVSLVFFYELDPDTVVESLGPPVGIEAAPPVRAADYLADKLAAITVAS